MKWFNNLRVSMKVFLSCFILIIILITLGINGISSIRAADEALMEVYDEGFVHGKRIHEIYENILVLRVDMVSAEMFMQENKLDDMKEHLNSADKAGKIIDKELKEIEKSEDLSKEEKKLITEVMEDHETMEKLENQIRKHLLAGELKLASEINDKWEKPYEEIRKHLIELLELQQKNGEKLKAEQDIAMENNLLFTILLMAIAVILGIIISIVLSRSVSRPVRLGLSFAQKLAEGDLTNRIDLDQKDELGRLSKALNDSADNLENLISNVIIGAQNLAQAVDQISSGNQNLSQRTSEQASSLEEVASTIEEATSAINQNAENATEANKQANTSASLASEGGVLVNDAVASINEINQTSKQIGDIISVINEIAFQTNLLALNAAVEAARAGEQGRGFAVVAGEVRNLAQRSGNAAKEIGDLIKDSIEKIEVGTEKANKSGESLTEIINSIDNVSKLIAEIAAASNEQKQGIGQINTAIGEMDTMTQQNSALVEETASASEEMANQSTELLNMVQKFKINQDYQQSISSTKKRNEIHITDVQSNVKKENITQTQKKSQTQAFQAKHAEKNDISTMMNEEGFEEF